MTALATPKPAVPGPAALTPSAMPPESSHGRAGGAGESSTGTSTQLLHYPTTPLLFANPTPLPYHPTTPQRPTDPPRTLNTLQLGSGWFPEHAGGLERFYYDLLRALPNHNVNCRGLVIGSNSIASETAGQVSGFATASDSLFTRWMRARNAVKSALETEKFDLVVSHFSLYTWPVLHKVRRLPLVVHFQGPIAGEAKLEGAGKAHVFLKYQLEQGVYRRASRLIVLSGAFRDILIRDYDIDPDRIRIIPGGVDAARFDIPETRVQAREKLDWPTDRPIVLCVRRLANRMGLEDLIDAAVVLRKSVPDLLILIAGRGRLLESLQSRIDGLDLATTVRLLGFVPDADLPYAYRAADLTVVPSTALEGFGLVAAESLAAGTPAFVTPVGGLPSAVRGLASQLILEAANLQSIVNGLGQAFRSGMSLPSSDQCREHAVANFDWQVIASRASDAYCEAMGGAP